MCIKLELKRHKINLMSKHSIDLNTHVQNLFTALMFCSEMFYTEISLYSLLPLGYREISKEWTLSVKKSVFCCMMTVKFGKSRPLNKTQLINNPL